MSNLFTTTDAPDLTRVRDFPKLTKFSSMNSKNGAWEPGTIWIDANEDGSIFRISGAIYISNASTAWSSMPWIPGTSNKWAGWKTIKVKAPSKAKIAPGIGLIETTSSSLYAHDMNHANLIVGTDGYVYVPALGANPGAVMMGGSFWAPSSASTICEMLNETMPTREGVKTMSFKKAVENVRRKGKGKYGKEAAAAIVASASRNASPAAKRRNPKLNRVK